MRSGLSSVSVTAKAARIAPSKGTSARTVQRIIPLASFLMLSMPGINSVKLRNSPKNFRARSMLVLSSNCSLYSALIRNTTHLMRVRSLKS